MQAPKQHRNGFTQRAVASESPHARTRRNLPGNNSPQKRSTRRSESCWIHRSGRTPHGNPRSHAEREISPPFCSFRRQLSNSRSDRLAWEGHHQNSTPHQ